MMSGAKRSTISRKLAATSSFYKYLIRQEYISYNPTDDVEPVHVSRRAPEYMSKEEVKVVRTTSTYNGLLVSVVIELLISTGMRVSELCSLNRDDIDLEGLTATVIGKGDKQRTVFISERASSFVREYLISRDDGDPAVVYHNGQRLNRFQVYHICTSVGKKYIGRSTNPHLFRHTIATHSALSGMPIQEVQQILGHSNVNTTMRYVHPSKQIREHHANAMKSLESGDNRELDTGNLE